MLMLTKLIVLILFTSLYLLATASKKEMYQDQMMRNKIYKKYGYQIKDTHCDGGPCTDDHVEALEEHWNTIGKTDETITPPPFSWRDYGKMFNVCAPNKCTFNDADAIKSDWCANGITNESRRAALADEKMYLPDCDESAAQVGETQP